MLKVVDIIKLLLFYIICGHFLKKKKNSTLYTIAIIFVLLFTIRSLGLDYIPYKKAYYLLGNTKFKLFSKTEPLILALIIFLNKLGLSHIFYFGILLSIPIIINVFIIKKNSKYKILTFFLLIYMYFFPGYMGAIRQNVAASFFLLSILISNKTKQIFYFGLAFSSHYSTSSSLLLKEVAKRINLRKYYYLLMFIIPLLLKLLIFLTITILENSDRSNPISFKIYYYLKFYNKSIYVYLNSLHKWLWRLRIYMPEIGSLLINLYLLKKCSFIFKLEKYNVLFSLSLLGTLISISCIILGIPTLGSRLNLTASMGQYLLISKMYEYGYKKLFYYVLFYYGLYNIICILYNAGIFDPISPLYFL